MSQKWGSRIPNPNRTCQYGVQEQQRPKILVEIGLLQHFYFNSNLVPQSKTRFSHVWQGKSIQAEISTNLRRKKLRSPNMAMNSEPFEDVYQSAFPSFLLKIMAFESAIMMKTRRHPCPTENWDPLATAFLSLAAA